MSRFTPERGDGELTRTTKAPTPEPILIDRRMRAAMENLAMPSGICRSMGPVVSMAVLMPPVPALAQEAALRGPAEARTVTEAAGRFVIRDAREAPAAPISVRLGRTIRLDSALVRPPRRSGGHSDIGHIKGAIHETR